MERTVCFITEASNPREGQTRVYKLTLFINQWAGALKRVFQGVQAEGGAPCRNCRVSSDCHLEIGHWWCEQNILIVLSTGSLQFQGLFVPISIRPSLRTVAAYIMATAWSSCS